MADFAITRQLRDGVLHVAVTGEVDMATSDQLAAATHEAVTADDLTAVVVDLDRVTFMDSSGIRTLLTEHEFAAQHGVDYRITRPGKAVRRVLEITGVLTILTKDESRPGD